MIQRVQTLYLGLAIIMLSVVTFGVTLFSFVNETSRFSFNAYGILETNIKTGEKIGFESFPLYIGTIALSLLCVIAIMSYKNLARQYKLGRTIFGLYFISLVGILVLSIYGDSMIEAKTTAREMGLGFFLFVAGFPFTFLANTGIKRDKRLLESLDRLR
ncbi:MAG: DUF4293 domain-containing protein [Crocinitomicaceae bacterium]|nr:DUF4293 domain-containing protein [Crocinitomicaceae bacterium]MDG2440225.1 DUF4293 domain-containing protein [Crocinitomicaceae bacterium]